MSTPLLDARLRRETREREEHERLAQRATRLKAIDADLEKATPLAVAGSPTAMRCVITLLAEKHNFQVEVRTDMPSGAAAFANWETRTIVIPPIVDAETFAVALHEAGHLLSEPCTGRAPHQPDAAVRRWTHCLKCETDAWTRAMQLVPFSRDMHERLRQGLRSYRRSTAGPSAEVQRLDQLAGTMAWADSRLRHAKMQLRLEQLQHWNHELGIGRTR